ncbi:hypothetical protein FS837_004650 [Tulasnella sp. UAMH 9824]|nr:hypothetical protein FS837_004650 [Tulasnella sp. UAMH 9824]
MAAYPTVLPPEIWLVVLESLALPLPNYVSTWKGSPVILKSSPDIRSLSSVSRSFLQLADPYRFQEVHFVVDRFKPSTQKILQIEELLCLLERRPGVKLWIRTLSIGLNDGARAGATNFEKEYLALEPKIQKVVPELRRLRLLRCGYMYFSSSLLYGILRLPHLEILQLGDFQFIQRTADETPSWIGQTESPLRSLTLKSLGPLSTSMKEALIHLLQKTTLVELTHWPSLYPDQRESRSVNLFWVISTHIPDYVFTSLQELDIRLPDSNAAIQHFVQFGARCPNLISLIIGWNSLEDSLKEAEDQLRRSSLAEHPFPALREFDGPLALASIFVQGRPVHSVISDIWYGSSSDESGTTMASDIAALKPSIPLRVLHLAAPEWNEADIEAIAQHHPDLEELVYNHSGRELMGWSTRLGDAVGKLAKLKTLTLEFIEYGVPQALSDKLSDDHQTIAEIRSLCPNLQRANLGWLGIWELRP